jgi:hypothetical protein
MLASNSSCTPMKIPRVFSYIQAKSENDRIGNTRNSLPECAQPASRFSKDVSFPSSSAIVAVNIFKTPDRSLCVIFLSHRLPSYRLETQYFAISNVLIFVAEKPDRGNMKNILSERLRHLKHYRYRHFDRRGKSMS